MIYATLISALLATTPISSEPVCAQETDMLAIAKSQYNEVPVWEGMSDNGMDLTVTQSPEGTWTLFVGKGGIACLVKAGGPVKVQ